MGSDLFVATAGAVARLQDLEVVANNLANVDTLGFKRDRTLFEAVLEASMTDLEGRPTPGAPGRALTAVGGLTPDLAAGPVAHTGAPLDVAIQGEGFFEVATPEGPRYTRAGSFGVDPGGRLTTPEGHAVLGPGGPLRVGSRAARIRASGALVDSDGRTLGRLKLVSFERPELLVKQGASLYRALPEAGASPVVGPRLVEGSVERSNVSAVRELTHLIAVQRAFDAAMRTLNRQDRATARLLEEIGS